MRSGTGSGVGTGSGSGSGSGSGAGTGSGTTVRELVDAFNRVVARPVEVVETERRPGDVAGAYTRSDLADRLLGWRPRYSIEDGIRHSLEWAAVRDSRLAE